MYKYESWSLEDGDCFSWPRREERMLKIAELCGEAARDYEEASSKKGFNLDAWEDEYIKHLQGKDNNMKAIETIYLESPKFKINENVKFTRNGHEYRGVISRMEKKVNVIKDTKQTSWQVTDPSWYYTIIRNGTLENYNIKEDAIKIDDTPDYNKYFDFLFKQGITLDRNRYTWKSFRQETLITSGKLDTLSYNYGSISWGWKADSREVKYFAILCDKNTNKIVEFKGTQIGTDKLPAISEKC